MQQHQQLLDGPLQSGGEAFAAFGRIVHNCLVEMLPMMIGEHLPTGLGCERDQGLLVVALQPYYEAYPTLRHCKVLCQETAETVGHTVVFVPVGCSVR